MGRAKMILFAFTFVCSVVRARGAFVVVPNEGADWEGNAISGAPFSIGTAPSFRWQQVYDASQFSAIGPAGGFITQIFFRADCFAGGGSSRGTNIVIKMSTTGKRPDHLSQVFSENVGPDGTVVFGPGRVSIEGSPGTCPARFSGGGNPLSAPFLYVPSQGNLLMDVRNLSADWGQSAGWMDAADVPEDSVSSVYAESVDATNATYVGSLGIVTAFEFQPVPQLTVEQITNSVVLTWPLEPSVFVLQSSDDLAHVNWIVVTGITSNAVSRSLVVPLVSSGLRRFYRLAWESGGSVP